MDSWRSKTITESQFLLIDETFRDKIADLKSKNDSENSRPLRRARLYLMMKLRSFQSILKTIAVNTFKFQYSQTYVNSDYMFNLDDDEDKDWLWCMNDIEKLNLIVKDIEEQTCDIKLQLSDLYEKEIKIVLNNMLEILNDIYSPDVAQSMLYDVTFISF
jgi:hypothetical protein